MKITGRKYWAYTHHFSVQNAHSPTEYYSWDQYLDDLKDPESEGLEMTPPKDFNQRYYYYDENVALAAALSHEDLVDTDDQKEYEKCNEWRLTEMSSLEVRLTPEYSLLGSSGRKRQGPEQEEHPKAPKRGSSVPPHSSTAKARAKAEEKKQKESKGKGFDKGATKGSTGKGK